MGLDYSYEIYIPRERAWRLLAAVGENVGRAEADGWAAVRIDERRVVLPYVGWRDGQRGVTQQLRWAADWTDRDAVVHLDLLLRFFADDELRDYFASRARSSETALQEPDATGRYRLGYIYLSVHDDRHCLLPGHVRFSFTAATTCMSVLFWNSPSIRDWFVHMTVRTAASVCTLDMEGLTYLLYAHGHRMLEPVDIDSDNALATALARLTPA
ncbi:hypothetical protein [Nocardia huaxiensis]|uniref:Uncharacterized protein n=1 Tax=Nocardia huaxiensis TaxID=2755382 RepID=A0A7D6VBT1_9NOCA|nr:hypothetical protein [Nocardia huaxiensis]QLY28515.1 hypothetical protein H0264_24505 [Nocardia huaxiensis]UFS98030.1 hypothetical protein LPY97_09100 [Nocardia huaxiensis]